MINEMFLDHTRDAALVQIIHEPTRGAATLDLFLTNKPDLTVRSEIIPGLGDHDIVLVDSLLRPAKSVQQQRKIYLWKQANIDQIKSDTITFSNNLLKNPPSTVNETWDLILEHLDKVVQDHVPSKISRSKFHQPWICTQLKRLSRQKYRAWKKAKRSKKSNDWKRYKKLKKQTQVANRKAYFSYVSDMVSDSSDRKKLWRLIKNKKRDQTGVAPLKSDGLTYSGGADKAEILNKQFCSVFTAEDINDMPDKGNSLHKNKPDIHVSTPGVEKLLASLNPNKASGPDGVTCRLLKTVAVEIAPVVAFLFNLSLLSGEIPPIWKHAFIQPAFKKGDRNQPPNYRPISLTCVLCKMLEHIVRSSITKHLNLEKIVTPFQHGFLKRRSCDTQLLLTYHDLVSSLDKPGSQTDMIFLDFSKAFDKVPHQRLIHKLHYYGIRGTTLNWIQSFLSDRTQQVVVDGHMSASAPVTSGVPQGSVLGPTLFVIYINDLPEDIQSTVRLFADDTALYRDIATPEDSQILQDDLSKLEAWESKWQMTFNADKCLVLPVTRKKCPAPSHYKLHDQVLETVDSAKYLGVEFSGDLSWTKHINTIAAKANRASAFVHRNLRGCPREVQRTCYTGIVRPLVEYASTVWDPHQANLINTLEKTQRRAARRICQDFSPYSSASNLVRQLELDTLKSRRSVAKATMIYKMKNTLVDIDTSNVLLPSIRSSRGVKSKFQVPHTRTNTLLHSFFPSAIRIWNNLPPEAANAEDLVAFKLAVQLANL